MSIMNQFCNELKLCGISKHLVNKSFCAVKPPKYSGAEFQALNHNSVPTQRGYITCDLWSITLPLCLFKVQGIIVPVS